ncbi:hypothetical protein RYX36_004796 [Vicia faba]
MSGSRESDALRKADRGRDETEDREKRSESRRVETNSWWNSPENRLRRRQARGSGGPSVNEGLSPKKPPLDH